ncbi:MAG: hypothetical protein HOV97_04995 [Nonomuraea sp.]|nr:hypothetical protein [Nonomuraea sp.]
MNKVLIFGREPVVISNAIEGILACLLAFGLLGWAGINTADEIAIVMAVVSSALGVYVAYVTKDTLLGAVLGLIKAAVALIAAYGYDVTDVQLAQILAAVTVVAALWHRTQTGPAADPSLDLSQHSVEMPPDAESLAPVDVNIVTNGVDPAEVAKHVGHRYPGGQHLAE